MKATNEFRKHKYYNHIEAYKECGEGFDDCPCCGVQPRVWEFDNGRFTSCGCWNSKYDQHKVQAESIMSVHKRTDGKKMTEYDRDGLRKNWNHWCRTGEHLFKSGDGLW